MARVTVSVLRSGMCAFLRRYLAGVATVVRTPAAAVLAGVLVLSAGAAARPLRSVVILGTAAESVPGGWTGPAADGVDTSRVASLDRAEIEAVLEPFVGQEISQDLAGSVRRALQAWYGDTNHPFTTVLLPAQDARSGVLQVVVMEARLGEIQVQGNTWFDDGQYRNAFTMRPGDPIDTIPINEAVQRIGRNQYRRASVLATAGQTPGTTDLIVQANDRLPLTLSVGFDNTGTNATSLYRWGVGLNWGNALWRGDDFNYRFTASPDARQLRQHGVSYTTALPWGDSLILSGYFATTESTPLTSFAATGESLSLSLRYSIPLPMVAGITHHLDLGADYRSTNNDLLTGGASVFGTTSVIGQFVAEYGGQLADQWGTTGAAIALVGSPGNLARNNTDAAFNVQQPGATANYVYVRAVVERVTPLPRDFAWSAMLTGQYSDAILLPSEQLAFSGVQSIRGFVEQGVLRDNGLLLRNELRGTPMATGLGRLVGAGEDIVVPFLFMDAGFGRNHHDIPGTRDSWVTVVSAGPGVTWRISESTALRFTWGFPLVRFGQTGPLLGPQFGTQVAF